MHSADRQTFLQIGQDRIRQSLTVGKTTGFDPSLDPAYWLTEGPLPLMTIGILRLKYVGSIIIEIIEVTRNPHQAKSPECISFGQYGQINLW